MKLMRSVCLCAAAAALLAGSATAMTPASSARARVPFDFVVSGKTLPAGLYTFSAPNASGVVSIQNAPQGNVAMALGTRAHAAHGQALPQLVFVKKNGRFHLSEVRTDAAHGGAAFPVK